MDDGVTEAEVTETAVKGISLRGMALMEVLVATSLLAAGMLAVWQWQLHALVSSSDAGLRQRAAWLADDLLERLQLNSALAQISTDQISGSQRREADWHTCTTLSPCLAVAFVESELSAWAALVETWLPDADWQLVSGADDSSDPVWQLIIRWHSASEMNYREFIVEFLP